MTFIVTMYTILGIDIRKGGRDGSSRGTMTRPPYQSPPGNDETQQILYNQLYQSLNHSYQKHDLHMPGTLQLILLSLPFFGLAAVLAFLLVYIGFALALTLLLCQLPGR